MRPRTLFVLALLVAALGAFVWLVERDLPDTEEREERADRLLELDADEVLRLELAFDGERVVLEREAVATDDSEESGVLDPEWRLVEPIVARADGAAIGALLRRLETLDAERTLDAVEDRSVYGLDPPRLEMILTTGGGSTRLRVGASLPASTQRLVALDDSGPLRVVAGGVFDDAVRPAGDWRDRDLFPWSRSAIERIRLGGPSRPEPLLLARRGDAFWIEAPVVDAADPDRVDDLLLAVTGLRATSFVEGAEASAQALGDAGTLEITVDGRPDPIRIAFGIPAGEGSAAVEDSESRNEASPPGDDAARAEILRVDDQWVRATTDLRDAASGPAADWRSPRLTGWPVYDIDTVRLREGADELVLARDGVDWRRGEETILYSTVSDLLSALVGFRAASVEAEDAGEGPTGSDALEIVLTHKEGAQSTLRVRRSDDGVTIRPDGRDVVLRAPAATWESVAEAVASVREAEPLAAEGEPASAAGPE